MDFGIPLTQCGVNHGPSLVELAKLHPCGPLNIGFRRVMDVLPQLARRIEKVLDSFTNSEEDAKDQCLRLLLDEYKAAYKSTLDLTDPRGKVADIYVQHILARLQSVDVQRQLCKVDQTANSLFLLTSTVKVFTDCWSIQNSIESGDLQDGIWIQNADTRLLISETRVEFEAAVDNFFYCAALDSAIDPLFEQRLFFADAYESGTINGMPKSLKKAEEYYLMMAKQKNPVAQQKICEFIGVQFRPV